MFKKFGYGFGLNVMDGRSITLLPSRRINENEKVSVETFEMGKAFHAKKEKKKKYP